MQPSTHAPTEHRQARSHGRSFRNLVGAAVERAGARLQRPIDRARRALDDGTDKAIEYLSGGALSNDLYQAFYLGTLSVLVLALPRAVLGGLNRIAPNAPQPDYASAGWHEAAVVDDA
jgi:hypothetical protein